MSNNLYRKKPVVIEAFQMTKERILDSTDWPEWLIEAWKKDPKEEGSMFPTLHAGIPCGTVTIRTLEGFHEVTIGDWVIQGVKGELYPCKPEIFAMTYEPVEVWL